MFEWMTDPAGWLALLTLTAMEIVLGIDNVVFISVLVAKLPVAQAEKARRIGILLAFVFRLALLSLLTWLTGLTEPVLTIAGRGFSWRDIILFGGGLFLIAKATHELHAEVEGPDKESATPSVSHTLAFIIAQIALIDLVFSIDSIVTAIGMVEDIGIMIGAVIVAMLVMYAAAGVVGRFIAAHPTTKTLALSFLILIGVALCADGLSFHIPRGYIYASMAFAAGVEVVNILIRSRRRPI